VSASGFDALESLEFPALHPYYRQKDRRFVAGPGALRRVQRLAFAFSGQRTQKAFSQHFVVEPQEQAQVAAHIAVAALAEALEPVADKVLARHKQALVAERQAVAQAQETPSAAAPSGPPLTGSELEGLRVSVGRCWNVGTLSTEATETVVTAFVRMNRDGTPDNGSIRMLSYDGGSEAAAKRVFDTARRAIIRCGARGFPLPVEKYGQWREIEMTFNPEGVFWR
jgi:hypothetical protein